MNTSSPAIPTTTTLPGDVCPTWCGGEHLYDRTTPDGRPVHPEDCGVWHHGAPIDSWVPDGAEADEAIEVRIEGYRHDRDRGENRWPDEVCASNVHPGFVSGLGLSAPDARRLGLALLTAAATLQHTPEELRGPDQSDVDTLRGLLDLMADFPDNDQRARYLLSCNWMRDRGAAAGARIGAVAR